jgi:predicted transcriptional regulator
VEELMEIVTIEIASRDKINRRVREAFKGKKQGSYITFESADRMFQILTKNRRDLIEALAGAGPVSIREAARRVGRDVSAVHRDVHALIDAGIMDKTSEGLVVFPYDAVHIDATFPAAAE